MNTEFDNLLRQAIAGDKESARRLYDEHAEGVRRTVRRYLDPRLRRLYGSDDFLQSVWGSFFTRPPKPCTIRSELELERYLSAMARNKVIETGRQRLHTLKHAAVAQRPWTLEVDRAAVGREPTPSQAAMAEERWDKIRSPLPPLQQEMLDMLRQGYTHREIAHRYNIHPKVIQRLLRCLTEGIQW